MSRIVRYYPFEKYCLLLFSIWLGFCLGLFFWSNFLTDHCSGTSSNSKSFYEHFQYRSIVTCRNNSADIFLTIAVLSSHERLVHYLPAMLETWISSTTKEVEVVIFVEENSTDSDESLRKIFGQLNRRASLTMQACVYVVKLKHVANEYPPQKKSFYAMKFLYAVYRRRTSWILRLDDNAYVDPQRLLLWLRSVDHMKLLYIGQGGTGRVNGPAIHYEPGKYFCMGGSGIILSHQTLSILGPWLDQCYENETLTHHEDVELGRCIIKHLQIDCSKAYDSKHYFYHHYSDSLDFNSNSSSSIISRAFIVHPILNRTVFRQIHAFHQRQRLSKFQSTSSNLSRELEYHTFFDSTEFTLVRDVHYQTLDVRWKHTINTFIRFHIESLDKLWFQSHQNWTIIDAQPMFGYFRFHPSKRLELIVQILLRLKSRTNPTNRFAAGRKRLLFTQPLHSAASLEFREQKLNSSTQLDQRLHLIVVAKNKDRALKLFITDYANKIVKNAKLSKQFTLTILYSTNDKKTIGKLIDQYAAFINAVVLNETDQSYNRGLGRQIASELFSDDQYLCFLDVDLTFTSQALINIRHFLLAYSSKNSCAVFFPIVISRYSGQFSRTLSATIDGLFSIYAFGNVAMRKSDLMRVGGWDITNKEWGMEDVNLFNRFVELGSNCFVFRAAEPGLQHRYHEKRCNTIENKSRRLMCKQAQDNLIASQLDLVNVVERDFSIN